MHPEFPQDPDLIYLNHAAVAPWPRRTAEAIRGFAEENVQRGAAHYPRWMTRDAALRRQLQALLNAPSVDGIALVKNTSEAISFVASGLEWREGDNIVSSDEEFPSNRIPWEALKIQGVGFREARLAGADDPEQALFDLVDSHTRLIAISSVQYASGLRLNLARIGEFCQARGILFLVDAIQSLGALKVDVQECQADFVMADGHKWLLAPEGLGVFYVSARGRERVKPTQYGWHMVEKSGDYDHRDWQIARSAKRYECGSPNMLGIHALSASLSLLLETGIPAIEGAILGHTERLIRLIAQHGTLELMSSRRPDLRSGIVVFRHQSVPNAELWSHLKRHGVICALRGGGIRYSPHFYTEDLALERAVVLAASV
ncbi:MAG: aminotransferase class V-fold PLP-dependent enzyme [Methylococcaceae bacterium]|nr:aminotransferase class V-fold PLP-dependent enzyme [Methylococcaceae bacterium]